MENGTQFSSAVRSTETARTASQLLRKWYADAERARCEGQPVAWGMVGLPPEILTAFDLATVWPENFGTVCASRQVAVDFIERAESEGYCSDLCSYETNVLGYSSRYGEVGGVPPEAPMGGLPPPDLILTWSGFCDPRTKGFQAVATRYFRCPMYIADLQCAPYGVDMSDERVKRHYVSHNIRQLQGLVDFVQLHTGKKLDKERLREAVNISLKTQHLIWDIHQLRRAVPSPMPSEDQFACIIPQLYMLGSRSALEFYQRLFDEVSLRVQNGVGVVADEHFRLMWMGIPTWFNMGIFNYFESLSAPSVIETTYYVYPPVDVEVTEPIEALAEIVWARNRQLHDLGAEVTPEAGAPAGLALQFCKEYHVDGVVMHKTRSCRAITFGQAHTRKLLQETLEMPVLSLESDMADPRQWSDARVKAQIDAFFAVLATGRGHANSGILWTSGIDGAR